MSDTEPQVKCEPVVDHSANNGDSESIPLVLEELAKPDLLPANAPLPNPEKRVAFEAAQTRLHRFLSGKHTEEDLATAPKEYRAEMSESLLLDYVTVVAMGVVYELSPYFTQAKHGEYTAALVEFERLKAERLNRGEFLTELGLKELKKKSGLEGAEIALEAAQRMPRVRHDLHQKRAKQFRIRAETEAKHRLASEHKRLDIVSPALMADLVGVARKHLTTLENIGAHAAFWERFIPTAPFDNVPKFPWPSPTLSLASLLKWAIETLRFRIPEK
jgi:hypothetical protein